MSSSSTQHQQQQHSSSSSANDYDDIVGQRLLQLQEENKRLQQEVQRLEKEKRQLEQQQQHHHDGPRIVLETFEGEGKLRKSVDDHDSYNAHANPYQDINIFPNPFQHNYRPHHHETTVRSTTKTVHNDTTTAAQQQKQQGTNINYNNNNAVVSASSRTVNGHTSPTPVASTAVVPLNNSVVEQQQQENDEDAELWCDSLSPDGTCPLEPDVSFSEALRDRAYWLVGLLVLQSASGLILAHNEGLLAQHPVIVYFLTMLVGAGGNAGNQASVRVIRGLALGTLNDVTVWQFLGREFKMAMALSALLSTTGFLRAVLFGTPLAETVAVTTSLGLIVFVSICLGAILPLILQKCQIDPAHSSTTIQVVMDILGVLLAVSVSRFLLNSPIGTLLIQGLSGGILSAVR